VLVALAVLVYQPVEFTGIGPAMQVVYEYTLKPPLKAVVQSDKFNVGLVTSVTPTFVSAVSPVFSIANRK
jgi:hypothetical protein